MVFGLQKNNVLQYSVVYLQVFNNQQLTQVYVEKSL